MALFARSVADITYFEGGCCCYFSTLLVVVAGSVFYRSDDWYVLVKSAFLNLRVSFFLNWSMGSFLTRFVFECLVSREPSYP